MDQSNRSSVRQVKTTEAAWVRWGLIFFVIAFLVLMLLLPLGAVFLKAFEKGLALYAKAVSQPDVLASIRLTFLTVAVSIPLNVIFGVAAAWCIAKFSFKGKQLLLTLIDLPFAISPVVAGLVFIFLLGKPGVLGPWLAAQGVSIIFNTPGIILVTLFVTLPFVARELIPVMQAQGTAEEEAARILGASGWQIFWRVTLPNVKWALFYGVILASARAVGEFGAVSVVSGHIRGLTNTMPLQVEILYNEYQFTASFAVASLMTLLAVVTLLAKQVVEWRSRREVL